MTCLLAVGVLGGAAACEHDDALPTSVRATDRCRRDGPATAVVHAELVAQGALVARYERAEVPVPEALRQPADSPALPLVVCVHGDGRVRLLDQRGEADLPAPPPPPAPG